MGKTWVLETDTKGTGARLVPIERTDKRSSATEPVLVRRRQKEEPKAPAPVEPQPPHQFRIVDVMTRETVLDGVDAQAAVNAIAGVRSIVDVNVYVRRGEQDRWRQMTFGELRALRELAGERSNESSRGPAQAR